MGCHDAYAGSVDQVTTVTAATYLTATGTALPAPEHDTVHVVVSDDSANSLNGRKLDSYRGYTLVYHAATGVLLSAGLGRPCPRP